MDWRLNSRHDGPATRLAGSPRSNDRWHTEVLTMSDAGQWITLTTAAGSSFEVLPAIATFDAAPTHPTAG
jgi:hypothetical protein